MATSVCWTCNTPFQVQEDSPRPLDFSGLNLEAIFDLNLSSEKFEAEAHPFCPSCSKMIEHCQKLKRRQEDLTMQLCKLRNHVATNIINSFSATPCHRVNYGLKCRIYENWFARVSAHTLPESAISSIRQACKKSPTGNSEKPAIETRRTEEAKKSSTKIIARDRPQRKSAQASLRRLRQKNLRASDNEDSDDQSDGGGSDPNFSPLRESDGGSDSDYIPQGDNYTDLPASSTPEVKGYPCPRTGCGKLFQNRCTLEAHLAVHEDAVANSQVKRKPPAKSKERRKTGSKKEAADITQSRNVDGGPVMITVPVGPQFNSNIEKVTVSFNIRRQEFTPEVVDGVKRFVCPAEGCGKVYLNHWFLEQHYTTHQDESGETLECYICGHPFTREYSLSRHIKCHNPKLVCNICGQQFVNRMSLRNHERFVHHISLNGITTERKSLNSKPKMTTGKDKEASSNKSQQGRRENKHDLPPPKGTTNKVLEKILKTISELDILDMKECPALTTVPVGARFNSDFTLDTVTIPAAMKNRWDRIQALVLKPSLFQAVEVEEIAQMYACPYYSQCGTAFESLASIRRHFLTHLDSLYECYICGQPTARDITSLKRHVALHAPNRKDGRFTCNMCMRVLSSQFCLDKHRRKVHNIYLKWGKNSAETKENMGKKKKKNKKMGSTTKGNCWFDDDMLKTGGGVMFSFPGTGKSKEVIDFEVKDSNGQVVPITTVPVGSKFNANINSCYAAQWKCAVQAKLSGVVFERIPETKTTTDMDDMEEEEDVKSFHYRCPYQGCGKQFSRVKAFQHYNNAHQDGVFECHICGRPCTYYQLGSHVDSHKSLNEEPDYECEDCGMQFRLRNVWRVHRAFGKRRRLCQGYFACGLCLQEELRFRFKGQFLKHNEEKHPGVNNPPHFSPFFKNANLVTPDKKAETSKKEKESTLLCHLCPFVCNSNKMLKEHITDHDTALSIPCPDLLPGSKQPKKSVGYLTKVRPDDVTKYRFRCLICPTKPFLGSQERFEKHNKWRHPNVRVVVNVEEPNVSHLPASTPVVDTVPVGPQFNCLVDANEVFNPWIPDHIRRVCMKYLEKFGNTQPYSCPESLSEIRCKKKFNSTGALHKHYRIHLFTKYPECHICGQPFPCDKDPLEHIATHSGKHENKTETYRCSICLRQFLKYQSLFQHNVKIHLRRKKHSNTCEICLQDQGSRLKLYGHMKKIHPSECKDRHKCKYCDLWFPRSRDLRNHVKKHFRCRVCVDKPIFNTFRKFKAHNKALHPHLDALHTLKNQTPYRRHQKLKANKAKKQEREVETDVGSILSLSSRGRVVRMLAGNPQFQARKASTRTTREAKKKTRRKANTLKLTKSEKQLRDRFGVEKHKKLLVNLKRIVSIQKALEEYRRNSVEVKEEDVMPQWTILDFNLPSP